MKSSISSTVIRRYTQSFVEYIAIFLQVTDSVTPPSATPPLILDNQRMRETEDGIQINMFGSLEQNEKLMVTIPLTKIKMKMMFGRIPKKSSAVPNFQAPSTAAPLFPENSVSNQYPPKHALLSTPPLHTKLTPEDFQRMENMPHEYWEAPELTRPHPPSGPPPPPQWRPPPPMEQSYRARPPYPPRHRPPFYRPPMPHPPPPPEHHQSWSPPHQWPLANSTESGPLNRAPNPGNWSQNAPSRPDPNASGRYPRPSGVEQRPSGIDSRPSGMDPRPGGMEQRPGGVDPRQGGVDPRPSGMDPRPSGMDPRPSGMDPRHAGSDPRHSMNNPRASVHNNPRNSPSLHHSQRMKWGQSANMEPRQTVNTEQRPMQSSPPYAGQHGMSPPLNYGSNKQGWSDKISPNWKFDRVSPAWSLSPDHTSPSAKVGDDAAAKRMDPRKKYSHLKIKSKNSPGSGSSKDSYASSETSTSLSGPGFKIPKLLTNSTGLDKPIDPKELFGNDGVDSQPYGEITFGTYKSPFNQSSSSDIPENTNSDHPASSHATTQSDSHTSDGKSGTAGGHEVTVPSYFAQIESELGGGGLEIESAFGSLSEKSKDTQSQESHARKLPSVFGFGR